LAHVEGLDYIALKPSSFRFQTAPFQSLVQYLVQHKKKVLIDAEDVANQDAIHELTDACLATYNDQAVWVYKTYQMYRRDSLARLTKDLQQFPSLGVKLVRGAYMKQDNGTGLLYNQKADTDTAFRKAVQLSVQHGEKGGLVHTMVCTHNPLDIRYLIDHQKHNRDAFIHASLYGFIPKDTQLLVQASVPTYKYLPYGPMEAAIPYLLRRIQENPLVLRYYFS
jgi:proline dehydrogenase